MTDANISNEELAQLFQADESDRLERTEECKQDKIGKTICAFANDLHNYQKPGILIIGQKDNKECANLNISESNINNIANFSNDGRIMPPPMITVRKHNIEGCSICVVAVKPHRSPPVRYNHDCWVRVGASTKKASVTEERYLNEKIQSGDTPFIEQEVNPSIPLSELNLDYFREQYLPQAISKETLEENQRDKEHQLQSLRFLSAAGQPNNAAVLCFHNQPHHVIRGAYIQFVRAQGDNLDAPIASKKEIIGNIFEQTQAMDEILRANIEIAGEFSNGRRRDKPNYPLVALQEILRNALVHRLYEGTNAPIRFYWFSDRIEISSPGGPYGQVTAENFSEGRVTDYRNLLLATAMTTMGFAERFGYGISKANRAMKKNGNPDIEFQVEREYILATFRPATI